MLDIKNIAAEYNGKIIFQNLDFNLQQGKTAVVLGPNGCGKTTLLSIIASQKKPYKGTVNLGGVPIKKGDTRIGFILQSYGIFPWFNIEKNISLPMQIREMEKEKIAERAKWAMNRFNLTEYKNCYPAFISGGEKQKLALARTMVMNPELLLMDEPFSAIDAFTREELQLFLKDLLLENKITALIVTHSIEEAVFLADKIYIMNSKPSVGFAGEFNIDRSFKDKKDSLFFSQVNDVKIFMEKIL